MPSVGAGSIGNTSNESNGVSLGAFLNVLDYSPGQWRDDVRWLDSLPDLRHVEVWLEWLPGTSREANVLRDLLGGRSIIVHGPFMGLSLTSHWKEHRNVSIQRLRRALDVALDLAASVMTIHPGPAPFFVPQEQQYELLLEAFVNLSDNSDGMLLSVENMPRGGFVSRECVVTVDDCLQLLSAEPSLNLTMDVGHFVRSGESYADLLLHHSARIVDIHLHDAIVGGRDHLPLGSGNLDIERFFLNLEHCKYDGFLSVETVARNDTSDSLRVCGDIMDGM